MPIYEYECLECGNHFDILRSIKEADTPITCQKCDSLHTKRQLSVFFAQSGGKLISGTNGGSGCSGCAGGSCASCGRN